MWDARTGAAGYRREVSLTPLGTKVCQSEFKGIPAIKELLVAEGGWIPAITSLYKVNLNSLHS